MKSKQKLASPGECGLQAVADGEVTPSEANDVMALIGSAGKALELTDLEPRISALENERGSR